MTDAVYHESESVSLTAEEMTPTMSATVDISQNSNGAWRGSIKVNVRGPIEFESRMIEGNTEIPFDIDEDTGDLHSGNAELTFEPVVDTDGRQFMYLSTPSQSELDITSTVKRTVSSLIAQANVLATYLNEKVANDKVKAK